MLLFHYALSTSVIAIITHHSWKTITIFGCLFFRSFHWLLLVTWFLLLILSLALISLFSIVIVLGLFLAYILSLVICLLFRFILALFLYKVFFSFLFILINFTTLALVFDCFLIFLRLRIFFGLLVCILLSPILFWVCHVTQFFEKSIVLLVHIDFLSSFYLFIDFVIIFRVVYFSIWLLFTFLFLLAFFNLRVCLSGFRLVNTW